MAYRMSLSLEEDAVAEALHHASGFCPEKSGTTTTSMVMPLVLAVRAAVSMADRSESDSQPPGSVTMPLVVTGEVANAGAPSAIRNVERRAAMLKRRVRDTGSSCVVANRQTYITRRVFVDNVTQSTKRDRCREVSLRD